MPILEGKDKIYRMLDLYERFSSGQVVIKKQIAEQSYHVSEKSVQRDISDLNEYLAIKKDSNREITFSKEEKGYCLKNRISAKFSDSDIFALAKVLFESRAFSKPEMERIISTLLCQCDDKQTVKEIIQNERFYYVPPQHGQDIVDLIWKISQSIRECRYVTVTYERQDKLTKARKLKPRGLIFNEYYFYLIAEICGIETDHPAVFRVDRLHDYTMTEEYFSSQRKDRFEESEYRKRIQFMYQGDLIHLQFKFWGDSLEAVLDRIPSALVINPESPKSEPKIIKAEVYDKGIVMWLLSQQEFLEVTQPESLRKKMKETIERMRAIYDVDGVS